MASPIRVGIIGVSPDRGWAAIAHIPVLRALDQYEITAVATRRQESAELAARHFGVKLAFADADELARHPEVDVVVICVNAAGHYAALLSALNAGKHVFCEWPLCADTAQAAEVAALAKQKNVRQIMGLQARATPMLNYAKDLVVDGYVGRVLSCTMLSSWRKMWGEQTLAANAYTLDRRNGATALSIATGHCIDALTDCVGDFQSLSATVAAPRDHAIVTETGERVPMTAQQQVTVSGLLGSGAVASVHIQGGTLKGTGLHFEINGTAGALVLSSNDMFGVTSADLALRGIRNDDAEFTMLVPPRKYYRVPESVASGRPLGTAQLYVDFAAAIRGEGGVLPDFEHALKWHRLLDAIQQASDTGQRQIIL